MRTISSDEINFLIYRYLQESGFKHSAFTFGFESCVHKSNINYGSEVTPGALISFIQKGIQYMEIEAKLKNRGNAESNEVKYNSPFELLLPQIKQKISKAHNGRTREAKRKRESHKEQDQNTNTTSSSKHSSSSNASDGSSNSTTITSSAASSNTPTTVSTSTNAKKADTMDIVNEEENITIPESKVTVLRGHTHEVFICAWSPTTSSTLASASGDSTARIWTLPPGTCGEKATELSSAIVLKHCENQGASNDVTTLDWNSSGTKLATGSYDGKARIWNCDGSLSAVLDKHKGPIFSLKWNKRGDYLLSGSVDNTAIIWDANTGEVKQQFKNHTAPTLDVDWRTDTSFATCSTDKMIYVCKLSETKPLRVFQGHEDEVNAIRWDPSGSLLASCSDDYTAKIWSMKSDRCIFDLKEHTKEIYTIKWSPTGPGTNHPNKDLVLASASFDASIKIWDINAGKCLYSLTKHTDPVYSVSFSPDGEFLASGSYDRYLHIWSVKDGKLIRTYQGSGSIFEVCWNCTGDKVAACFSNSVTEDFTVCVIDFRM